MDDFLQQPLPDHHTLAVADHSLFVDGQFFCVMSPQTEHIMSIDHDSQRLHYLSLETASERSVSLSDIRGHFG